MGGKLVLYIDQYGGQFWSKTVRELSQLLGSKHVERIYLDRNGKSVHIGYVIAGHWCQAFIPYEGV